ncbi:hypothetical protein [Corynebacterium sp. TAE3-ERU16]|uniref:hypothetical protein n=1 Tax=Corynebacterium sp. TAE3-ERU16 TaxID=2849493 RepID=UPI001C45D927|nr:hypothetical protein [Corynebacterium sp. TAE3-ERU16]MBV7292608.1 hypothetical protein [Corynebacterium sp. TAE3-ERU16]
MNTPNSPREGWNPGPYDPSAPAPGWSNGPNGPSAPAPGWSNGPNPAPSWDPAASGTDMGRALRQEEARSIEQTELRQRGAARWVQISTALAASVAVVAAMVWGWQQLFWLELFNDTNNYIETADGRKLVNEELIEILGRSGKIADTTP